MNFRHVRMLLLLFTMILWNVLLNAWILERTRQINCFSYETALYSFREHRVSGELLARMQEEAEEKGMSEKELLAVYFAEDGSVTDPGQLAVEALYAKRYQPQAYARICGCLLYTSYVALILTVVSLIDYIVKNKDVLKDQK